MTFSFVQDGELPAEDNYSIVVCITKDGISKKGAATLQTQKREVGHVVHHVDKKRRVFYLITRTSVNCRISCDILKQCLRELRLNCDLQKVNRLAVPDTLGAGKEVLSEKTVMDCLFTAFEGWEGKMVMYHPVNRNGASGLRSGDQENLCSPIVDS